MGRKEALGRVYFLKTLSEEVIASVAAASEERSLRKGELLFAENGPCLGLIVVLTGAIKIFKLNAERNGDAWPVHVGLARAYSANGDYKQALEHAQKALTQAPDELNRNSLKNMVQLLSEGKPIS